MNKITSHTTTTELGVMFAEHLSELAVKHTFEGAPESYTGPDPHGLAIAAVRAIESTELVINALGKTVAEMPAYEKRLEASMNAAVWVTGIPEDQLRNTEDGPGFENPGCSCGYADLGAPGHEDHADFDLQEA